MTWSTSYCLMLLSVANVCKMLLLTALLICVLLLYTALHGFTYWIHYIIASRWFCCFCCRVSVFSSNVSISLVFEHFVKMTTLLWLYSYILTTYNKTCLLTFIIYCHFTTSYECKLPLQASLFMETCVQKSDFFVLNSILLLLSLLLSCLFDT